MSTAVQIYDRVTDTLQFTERLGDSFYKSGMFGCKTPAQGQVLALACASERLSPIVIKRRYHLIDGELSMRADAMLAEFRQRGGKHEILSRTADESKIQLSLDGQTHVESLTWAEAQSEPFVWQKDGKTPKKNWATPRARKQTMWARVVSDGVRAVCPEVCAGAYTPEEMDHIEVAESNSNGKSPSAADVDAMLKAAAEATKNGGPPIDAEFVVTPDDQPAAVASGSIIPASTSTTTPVGIAANDKDASPRPADSMPCTAEMRNQIESLFSQLNLLPEQRESALKKRGASVVRNLTINAASDLINSLNNAIDKLKAEQTAAGPLVADPPPFESGDEYAANDTDPCGQEQSERIKNLIRDIGDPGLGAKIKAKLTEAGLSTLADLSVRDAAALETCLRGKNVEAWAERALVKSPKN